jgi:hypothetical protein
MTTCQILRLSALREASEFIIQESGMLEKITDIRGKPELINTDLVIRVSPNSERRDWFTIYLIDGHEVVINRDEYARLYE